MVVGNGVVVSIVGSLVVRPDVVEGSVVGCIAVVINVVVG